MQSPREVIDSLLRKRPADRVGLAENIWGDTLAGWVEQGYPTGEDGKAISPAEHFGYDLVGAGGWFDCLPLRGFSEVLEETDAWKVTRNGAGAAFKYWKHGKSGTPEHVDFLMTSRDVWDRDYRPHLLEVDRERLDVEGTAKNLKACRERGVFATYGHLFIWENMRQSMGDMCMYESLLLDPDWIHDYNRVNTDFFINHIRVLFEEAGVPDGYTIYEDLGYKNGLFCSPETLKELIFPYFREMADFVHSYDIPILIHTCGGITDALSMLAETGFDYVDPMERRLRPVRLRRGVRRQVRLPRRAGRAGARNRRQGPDPQGGSRPDRGHEVPRRALRLLIRPLDIDQRPLRGLQVRPRRIPRAHDVLRGGDLTAEALRSLRRREMS